MRGLLLGSAIAIGIVAALGVIGAIAANPNPPGPLDYLFALGVAVVAGGAGGWVAGPRAATARTRLARIGVVLLLAVVATVIGALVLGFLFGLVDAVTKGIDLVLMVPFALVAGLFAAAMLLGYAGWLALPFVAVAAALWLLLMSRFRGESRDG